MKIKSGLAINFKGKLLYFPFLSKYVDEKVIDWLGKLQRTSIMILHREENSLFFVRIYDTLHSKKCRNIQKYLEKM